MYEVGKYGLQCLLIGYSAICMGEKKPPQLVNLQIQSFPLPDQQCVLLIATIARGKKEN